MLSAIVPVRNEEALLPNCLKSLSFADEIIVLDSGSTDNSLNIARSFGAIIIRYAWKGFRYSHQLGAKKANHDWLLYLDADERISRRLRRQIQAALKDPQAQAYKFPRLNYIMGQSLKHGGWFPDYVTRLIHKDSLQSWVGELHEYPQIQGQTGTLSGHLYHLSHRGMDWKLEKSRHYTRLYAQILQSNNHPPVKVKNLFGAMAREFYYRAIRQSGWKDGFLGWLEIIDQTYNAFLVQAQLWELQQQTSMEQTYRQIDQKISREL